LGIESGHGAHDLLRPLVDQILPLTEPCLTRHAALEEHTETLASTEQRPLRRSGHVARCDAMEPQGADLVSGHRSAPIGSRTPGQTCDIASADSPVRSGHRVRKHAAGRQVEDVLPSDAEQLSGFTRGQEIVVTSVHANTHPQQRQQLPS
jgi:hypothetical protein